MTLYYATDDIPRIISGTPRYVTSMREQLIAVSGRMTRPKAGFVESRLSNHISPFRPRANLIIIHLTFSRGSLDTRGIISGATTADCKQPARMMLGPACRLRWLRSLQVSIVQRTRVHTLLLSGLPIYTVLSRHPHCESRQVLLFAVHPAVPAEFSRSRSRYSWIYRPWKLVFRVQRDADYRRGRNRGPRERVPVDQWPVEFTVCWRMQRYFKAVAR